MIDTDSITAETAEKIRSHLWNVRYGYDDHTSIRTIIMDALRQAHDLGAAGERERLHRDAECAQCGAPCCKVCSWCHGCERHVCQGCEGSHSGEPNGKNHGGIDPAAIRKGGEG